MRLLSMAAKKDPNILIFISIRTRCILLISVMQGANRQNQQNRWSRMWARLATEQHESFLHTLDPNLNVLWARGMDRGSHVAAEPATLPATMSPEPRVPTTAAVA
jgi:hypothetical protein